MKKILLFLLIVMAGTASAQNNDYLVSAEGIGLLKLGSKQAEVEKVLNKKLTLSNSINRADSWMDSAKAKYKNMDVDMYFERQYSDSIHFEMVMTTLITKSPLAKTKTGIGIGTDRAKIITDFDGYTIHIGPEYADDTYTTKSKTKSYLSVSANDDVMFIFSLLNKKVVLIELTLPYGDKNGDEE